jgi:acyl-CoA thioesterase
MEPDLDFDFDRETAVAPLGDGGYRAELSPAWSVHRGPNGGYLAAVALRALTEAVDDPQRAPRSLTIHYARPPQAPGSLDVVTRVERAGRSLTSLSARLVQGDQLIGLALAAFSRPRPGPEFCDLVPPDDVPPPDDCSPRRLPNDPSIPMPAIARRWETRWAVGAPPGTQGDTALAGGWIRLPEGRTVDALVVAAMTDGWIPPVFSRVAVPMVVPTVDLTIHFRTSLPLADARDDDWVLASFRTDAAADGFLEEDGSLWSRSGILLAQSRQLAAVLPLA